jgi:hypothetical protein
MLSLLIQFAHIWCNKHLTMITYAMMMAIQENTQSYAKRALHDDFIPIVMETCGCFQSYFDLFLTVCA